MIMCPRDDTCHFLLIFLTLKCIYYLYITPFFDNKLFISLLTLFYTTIKEKFPLKVEMYLHALVFSSRCIPKTQRLFLLASYKYEK
jgi:hypothetical protein